MQLSYVNFPSLFDKVGNKVSNPVASSIVKSSNQKRFFHLFQVTADAAIINATMVRENHIGFSWIERLSLYLII